jgi:hypothetical protein
VEEDAKGAKVSIKHTKFRSSGVMAFGTVTANFQTLLALGDDADILIVSNSLDVPIVLRVPNETGTAEITLADSTSFTIDSRANDQKIAKGTVAIKAYSALPAYGLISVTSIG